MKLLSPFFALHRLFALSGLSQNRAHAELPPAPGPATGLADSAALRATVFGTPPQDIAPLPDTVPLLEMDLALPWRQPVPQSSGSISGCGCGFRRRTSRRRSPSSSREPEATATPRSSPCCAPFSTAPAITCSPMPSPTFPGLHRLHLEHRRRGRSRCRMGTTCTPRWARSSLTCRARCRSPTSTCSATVWAARMRPSSSPSMPPSTSSTSIGR